MSNSGVLLLPLGSETQIESIQGTLAEREKLSTLDLLALTSLDQLLLI